MRICNAMRKWGHTGRQGIELPFTKYIFILSFLLQVSVLIFHFKFYEEVSWCLSVCLFVLNNFFFLSWRCYWTVNKLLLFRSIFELYIDVNTLYINLSSILLSFMIFKLPRLWNRLLVQKFKHKRFLTHSWVYLQYLLKCMGGLWNVKFVH